MFDRVTPYYYSGEGEVLISERLEDGTPAGYAPLGKVSEARINVIENFLPHRESRHGNEIDKVVSSGTKVELVLTIDQLNADALAFMTRGEATAVLAGLSSAIYTVIPGFRYGVPRINLVAFSMVHPFTGVPYVYASNYEVDFATGGFKILTEAEQAGAVNVIGSGQQVKVDFSYGSQKEVTGLSVPLKEYSIRIEGMNTAHDKTPVVMEFYRVSPQIVGSLTVLLEKRQSAQLTTLLLKDQFKVSDDKFFKVMLTN